MKKIRFATLLMALAIVFSLSAKKEESESYNMKRGMEEINRGNEEEAMYFFNKEIEENKKNGKAHLALGMLYLDREDLGNSLSEFQQALRFLPSKDRELRKRAYLMRGEVMLCLGDTAAALSDYGESIKTDGSFDKAYYSRARVYQMMGRLDESDADLNRAMKINPGNPMAYVRLGMNEYDRGNYEKAAIWAGKALGIEKAHTEARSLKARADLALKNYVEAADGIIEAVATEYDVTTGKLLLEFPEEQVPMIVAKLKAKWQKDPYEGIWPYEISGVYISHGMYEEAIEVLEHALESDEYSAIHTLMGECYEGLGKYEEAIVCFRKAQNLWMERDTYLMSHIALNTEFIGALDAAVLMWDDIIALEPDNFFSYYRRGYIEANQRRHDEALADYEMALLLNPGYVHALLGKADMLTLRGDSAAAEECYRRIVELDVEPGAESVAMYAYAALGDSDRAREFMQQIIDSDPEAAGSYYEAACLYSKMGEPERALGYLETSLAKGMNRYLLVMTDSDLEALRETEGFRRLYELHREEFEEAENRNVLEAEEEETGHEEGAASTEARAGRIEIPYTPVQGCALVRCTINELPLSFVFDTGASVVSISQLEASFMLKNGYLAREDFIGTGQFVDANGDVSEGAMINLRNVEFGGLSLPNVRASVVRNQKAPLLLGQSVLGRLGSIEIDNTNKKIIISK